MKIRNGSSHYIELFELHEKPYCSNHIVHYARPDCYTDGAPESSNTMRLVNYIFFFYTHGFITMFFYHCKYAYRYNEYRRQASGFFVFYNILIVLD